MRKLAIVAPAIAALPYSGTISNQAVSLPRDTLTFSKLTGPAWLAVSADGAVSGIPTDADIGDNNFVVSLADTNGFFASATMNLSVNSNQPPFFTASSFSEPWANVDQAYSGSIASAATDPDLGAGDVLTFAKVSGPGWLGVAADGGLSGLPHGSNAGTNTFLVSVTDRDGSSNTATLYIYVNSAPSFSGLPIIKPSAISRLPYSGTIATNATDPDLGAGDSLAFYKVTGPTWLTVAPNGDLSGTAADSDVGTNLFLLLVVDSGGLAGVGTMSMTVNADRPPSFTSNPFSAAPAQVGVSYFASIATNAVDSDLGDKVAFAKVSGPAWLRVGVKGALIGTPSSADVGTNAFLISATDLGGLSTQATMYLSVIAPITLSISQQGSQITLSWTGGNPPYQVQTTTALDSPAWSYLGSPLGTNVLVFTPSNAASFYRIQGN